MVGHQDSEEVLGAWFGRGGDIPFHGSGAPVMAAHALAVDPDLGLAVDALGPELDSLARPRVRQGELALIGRQARLRHETLHLPVRRHFDPAPIRRRGRGRESGGRVSQEVPFAHQ